MKILILNLQRIHESVIISDSVGIKSSFPVAHKIRFCDITFGTSEFLKLPSEGPSYFFLFQTHNFLLGKVHQ